jgi:putative SOS response-associated peptidase YedK
MCNLYNMTPKGDINTFFRAIAQGDILDGIVAPFGMGMFIRADALGQRLAVAGQWGMVAPSARTRRPSSRTVLTNNARVESVAQKWTYQNAWLSGQRCLIPAAWYQEPNWETGKNVWWRMRRSDGLPWALAGIWSEWTDPVSGELLPNYSLLTMNCDAHPLLNRLHKPDPKLPPGQQDKRSTIAIESGHWDTWLQGSLAQAQALIQLPPEACFDRSDAEQTDALLAQDSAQASLL